MTSTSFDTDLQDLLREAARWRLIGLFLECPGEGWQDEIDCLAAEVGDGSLLEAAELARQEASPALYHTTFGPGGPAPPREVSYRRTVHPGRFLAEIGDGYRAFVYTPSSPEALDHVATEVGFVAYLCLKEAYAIARSDADQAGLCRSAARRFLEEHLAVMAQPLAAHLKMSGIGYLALAGDALVDRVGPPGGANSGTAASENARETAHTANP
ncbi:MAG: molecular chaperone TorD family protein [Rhodopirellula sp.]|nr:molecular chaperone TorD family protein [Rhodopirellula sp.]